MTGMNTANVKNGESPGLSIAISIYHRNCILITDLSKDKGLKVNQPYTKVSQQEKWNRKGRPLIDVR